MIRTEEQIGLAPIGSCSMRVEIPSIRGIQFARAIVRWRRREGTQMLEWLGNLYKDGRKVGPDKPARS